MKKVMYIQVNVCAQILWCDIGIHCGQTVWSRTDGELMCIYIAQVFVRNLMIWDPVGSHTPESHSTEHDKVLETNYFANDIQIKPLLCT